MVSLIGFGIRSRYLQGGAGGDGADGNNWDDDDEDDSSASATAPTYEERHKLVLEGMIAAGHLDSKGVKKLFRETCVKLNCNPVEDEHQKPQFMQKIVIEINEKIKHHGMYIASGICEITGDKFYVLISHYEKPLPRIQTFFSKRELEFFTWIMNTILKRRQCYQIPISDCIAVGEVIAGKTKSGETIENSYFDPDSFLRKMMSLQYFTKSHEQTKECVTLGFRSIMELGFIFTEQYSESFTHCCLCKILLLNGLKCPKCPTVIHRSCLRRYFKSDARKCMSCNARWENQSSLVARSRDNTWDRISPPVLEPAVESVSVAHLLSSGAEMNENGDIIYLPYLEPLRSGVIPDVRKPFSMLCARGFPISAPMRF